MHEVTVKGILSSGNGINLYRGCSHGCIYCDSRSSCYQMNHAFEDIEVKKNSLVLLEDALRRKRKKCMISTGAMTDPYLPLEEKLGYTRGALELIERYGFGATVITKSDLILRDLDLLRRINEKTKCVVQMTLTTYDEELCRVLEPGVASTKRRFEVLKIMQENQIPTVVWMTPILPFLNDTEENIRGILDGCKDAGVYGIICFEMGLTLREGNREYFYACLDRHFPGMKERYIKKYGNRYEVTSIHNKELKRIFYQMCREYHIVPDINKIFGYLKEFEEKGNGEQLTLF